MKKFKISVLLIIGLILIFLATTVISQAVSEIKTTVENAICAILRIFQALAAGVAALMIIMQGIKWMTSEDPAGRKAAKDMITHVFIAMIIIIIAVQFVNYLVTGTGIAEFTSCPGVTGPIVPPKGVDDDCTESSECNADLYCKTDKKCAKLPVKDELCATSIEGTTNLCKSGFECDIVTGKCKKEMTPPVAIITEAGGGKSVLECQDFTLYGDKSSDAQDGTPCKDCNYMWYEDNCNTPDATPDKILKQGINLWNLEYNYPPGSVPNAISPEIDCIRLRVTDSDGLSADSDQTKMVKVYAYKNDPPQTTDSTKPNYVRIDSSDLDNKFNKAALNTEEFTLTAYVTADNNGIKDKSEYSWGAKSGDCTIEPSSGSNKDIKIKIKSDDNSDQKCNIELTVKDSCNLQITATRLVNIQPNTAPTANIKLPSPAEVAEGSSFIIDGTESKTGGDCPATGTGTNDAESDKITKWEWGWSETLGGAIIKSATGEKPTIKIDKSGLYYFKLKVTDSHGATCERWDSNPFGICENLPATNNKPVAGIDSAKTTTTGKAGGSFTLDGSKSTDPDNTYQCIGSTGAGKGIKYYEWKDASQSNNCLCPTGANCWVTTPSCITTKLTQKGKHRVTLKVTDDAVPGKVSDNKAEIEIDVT